MKDPVLVKKVCLHYIKFTLIHDNVFFQALIISYRKVKMAFVSLCLYISKILRDNVVTSSDSLSKSCYCF